MFNYRDNFCTDKDSKFDYNALIKEIGTGQEWNLYFDLSGVLFCEFWFYGDTECI